MTSRPPAHTPGPYTSIRTESLELLEARTEHLLAENAELRAAVLNLLRVIALEVQDEAADRLIGDARSLLEGTEAPK